MIAVGQLDRFGILASSLCAVHCIAGAIAAAFIGAAPWLFDERFEQVFVLVAVVMAVGALGLGVRRHRMAAPFWAGLLGLAAICLARGVEFELEWMETVLSVSGACALVAAHVLNLRALRRVHRASI